MKIVKSVLLASALCASMFSLSGCSQTAQSQPETSAKTGQSSSVAELSVNTGKHCTVFSSNAGSPLDGNLKSVTASWIIIEKPGQRSIEGKTVQVNIETYIPTKDVNLILFDQPVNKK